MCTRDKEFTIRGIEDCLARGFDRTGFFEVDTGEQRSWTVQLTEAAEQPRPQRPAQPLLPIARRRQRPRPPAPPRSQSSAMRRLRRDQDRRHARPRLVRSRR